MRVVTWNCPLVRLLSAFSFFRSTEEIFGLFISIAFVVSAIGAVLTGMYYGLFTGIWILT